MDYLLSLERCFFGGAGGLTSPVFVGVWDILLENFRRQSTGEDFV